MTWHDMIWYDMIWYIYNYIIIQGPMAQLNPWLGGQLTEPKWICWGRLWMLQQLLLPHIDDIWAGFVQPELPFQWNTWWETLGFWGYISCFQTNPNHTVVGMMLYDHLNKNPMITSQYMRHCIPNISEVPSRTQAWLTVKSSVSFDDFPRFIAPFSCSMTSDRTGTFVNEVASRHHLRRPSSASRQIPVLAVTNNQPSGLAQKTLTVMCSFCFLIMGFHKDFTRSS